MMKILGIINSSPMDFSYGGVAPIMRNMHPFLEREFDVRYFYLEDTLRKALVPARLRFVFSLWKRRKALRECDFILCHVPEGAYVVSFLGVPYGFIYHGNSNPMSNSRYWYGKYFKRIFNLFYGRIEKTAALKYTVGPVWGDKKKLFNPIYHHISPVPCAERRGFIFAGRLEQMKNIDRLIRIYSKLSPGIREEHHFYIAGTGTQGNTLRDLSVSLGLAGHVHFLGNLPNEELVREVSRKRMLIMASSFEGLPTAIAEAFSVGVPVVSTNPGDIGLVLKNDSNGFIFPLDFKDEDYVKAIEAVLADYDRFAEAALESSSVFNAREITESVIKDINSCI